MSKIDNIQVELEGALLRIARVERGLFLATHYGLELSRVCERMHIPPEDVVAEGSRPRSRRLVAAELRKLGWSQARICRELHVTREAVRKWFLPSAVQGK